MVYSCANILQMAYLLAVGQFYALEHALEMTLHSNVAEPCYLVEMHSLPTDTYI